MAKALKDWEIQTEETFKRVNDLLLQLKNYSNDELCKKPNETSWSAEECMQHLNSYGRYYLPQLHLAIEKELAKNPALKNEIKGSWIGRKFTQMMSVNANGMVNSKLKAPKDHRPQTSTNALKTITEFEVQLIDLKASIDLCKRINLDKAKVPISISKWIKLSAGDVIDFYLAHHLRHLHQARRAMGIQ
jgi:hypothetical protein